MATLNVKFYVYIDVCKSKCLCCLYIYIGISLYGLHIYKYIYEIIYNIYYIYVPHA